MNKETKETASPAPRKVNDDDTCNLHQRMVELEQQFARIEQSKQDELAAIQLNKEETMQTLQRQYRAVTSQRRSRASRVHQQDQQLQENRKLLTLLRQENQDIRETNQRLATSIRALRINNERLRTTISDRELLSTRSLQVYHDRVVAEHDRLVVKCAEIEKQVHEAQQKVDQVTQGLSREHVGRRAYQDLLARIVELMSLAQDDDEEELDMYKSHRSFSSVTDIMTDIDAALEQLALEIKEDTLLADEEEEEEEENDEKNEPDIEQPKAVVPDDAVEPKRKEPIPANRYHRLQEQDIDSSSSSSASSSASSWSSSTESASSNRDCDDSSCSTDNDDSCSCSSATSSTSEEEEEEEDDEDEDAAGSISAFMRQYVSVTIRE